MDFEIKVTNVDTPSKPLEWKTYTTLAPIKDQHDQLIYRYNLIKNESVNVWGIPMKITDHKVAESDSTIALLEYKEDDGLIPGEAPHWGCGMLINKSALRKLELYS